MKKPTIIITAADYVKLSRMLALDVRSSRERDEARALERELDRAVVLAAEEIPPDVITMNTRAELLDLDTDERMEFTVVFPSDADIERGRISVLAPIGTGMLGYRVGDVFKQSAPTGVRRLKVVHVHFQPEAALAATAA